MKKNLLLILLTVLITSVAANAQELNARVQVSAQRISSEINKNVFNTLQTTLNNFLSTRRWTNDTYQRNERIKCIFNLNIDKHLGDNVFAARLTIQASRPVYGSTYDSPLLSFIDNDIVFKYQEFQPFEFNENRVQGSDPLNANLPAILAYYANIILGLDYSSFQKKAGATYFQKALTIVNNAPENRDIKGWKSTDGLRNRYWLAENINSVQYTVFYDALYSYYRTGLDLFSQNEEAAKVGVMTCLNFLATISEKAPNSILLTLFFQGKSNELMKVFLKSTDDLKGRAREQLQKLDIANASVYKELR